MKICPYCEQYSLRKNGKTGKGYQAYACYKCLKCCNDSPDFKPRQKAACPHCQSLNTRKNGLTRNTGYQRFWCNDCDKCFTDSPIPRGGLPKHGKQPLWKSIVDMERRKDRGRVS